VSNSSDPTAAWSGFQIDADSDDSHWADFPMLGLDGSVLTVSANMFGLGEETTTTTSFLVIPKSDLLAATPTVANATMFENIALSETGFAPQPIVDLDSGNLPLPILSSLNKSGGLLKTSSIGGTPTAPTLTTAGGSISVTPRGLPPDLDQPGPKTDIDAGDNRFSGNVVQQHIDGRANPSLWGVHNVDIGGRAAIEWYEIDAVANTLLQSGTIADATLAFNYPSIAVNDFGDVVIGFSGGSPSTFMSAYVAVGQTIAGVTTFDPFVETHAGVADYELLDGIGRNRWGDYSATVIDPTNQQRFWTFQEFVGGTDQWSVRVTEIVILSSLSIGSDVTVSEGDTGTVDAVFVVAMADPVSRPVTVAFTTVDVTAVAPEDYQPQSGTLTFLPGGSQTQTITIKVVGDTLVELNETFVVQLGNPSGAALGRSTAVSTILNDDIDVVVNDLTIVEGHSGTRDAVFAVSAVGAVNKVVTVSYTTINGSAISAEDYLPRAGVATITPGASAALVTVPVIGDRLDEGDHSFLFFLHSAVGARIADDRGTATILDDDGPPALYVNDVQVKATSGESLVAVFTVGLDFASGQSVTVNFATADGDAQQGIHYQGQSGTLTFAPGVTTRQISVPVMTSAVPVADKSFFLNLSSPANASLADAQGVGTIIFAPEPEGETIIDNGSPGYSRTAGWTTVTNTLANGLDYDYAASGTGGAKATWSFTGLAPGSYQVFTRWVPFSNRATNASYTIRDGATLVGSAVVNQQLAPAGELSNGITWQSLGFFQTATGNLAAQLTNAANGFVIADAVRVVANGIPPQESEMNVGGGSQSIATGDTAPAAEDGTEFGSVGVGSDSGPHTFTINNTGNATLALTGTPAVAMSGPNAADFVVIVQPSAAIGAGGSTTFQITFQPSGSGLREATVSIANNDDTEHPYTFAVQGTGLQAVAPLAHNNTFPQDVNNDARVTANDALIVINAILANRAGLNAAPLAAAATGASSSRYYVDVNGDGRLSPLDVLMVVNYILGQSARAQAAAMAAPAVDQAMVLMDDTADDPVAEMPPRVELEAGGDTPPAGSSQSVAMAFVTEENDEPEDDDELDPVLLSVGL
jgi:hypothetical protein